MSPETIGQGGQGERGRGGTFFRFSVGDSGMSAKLLSYISREEAVLDREKGILLYQLPPFVLEDTFSFQGLRDALRTYAWTTELDCSSRPGRSTGRRTHYRALFSFERTLSPEIVLALTRTWLEKTLSHTRAIGFLHRNTDHPHVHLWIAARDVQGKSLNISAGDYRRLDEVWNQIYSRALGRPEREHLEKKWQREAEKKFRHDQRDQRDQRNRQYEIPLSQVFQEKEISKAKEPGGIGDSRDGRTHTSFVSFPTARTATTPPRERSASPGESATHRLDRSRQRTVEQARFAISATRRLREDFARLVERLEHFPHLPERQLHQSNQLHQLHRSERIEQTREQTLLNRSREI